MSDINKMFFWVERQKPQYRQTIVLFCVNLLVLVKQERKGSNQSQEEENPWS